MIKEQEIPKYFKQKESNVSKAKKKSKHKHHYEECLIQYYFNKYYFNKRNNNPHTSLSIYCTICGKLGDRFKEDKSIVKDYRRIIDTSTGRLHQVMTSEELYERYHDKLPVFFVEDYWKDGYVNLERENNSEGE